MQPAPRPEISVAVVSFNSGVHLMRCLRALEAQTFVDFEVLVIDNASQDAAFGQARDAGLDSRFHFHANEKNLGFAAANNVAATFARGRWFALLNPDAFPEPDWLEEMVAARRRHPGVRMFGSTQIDDRDPLRLDGAGDFYSIYGIPWRGGHGRPVSLLPAGDYAAFSPCAAAALYDLELFRSLGGFDETFFCYCEDVDFGFRARLCGEMCIQVPAAIVRHVGGASSPDGQFAREHGIRNMILLHVKNMPAILLPLTLPMLFLAVAATIFASPRLAGSSARGALRALAGLPAAIRSRRTIRRTVPTGAIVAVISFDPRDAVTKAIPAARIDEPPAVA